MDHFIKVESEEYDTVRVICNYCGANYAWPSACGTSTLRAYLGRCKKYPYNNADKKQKTLAFKTSRTREG